MGKGFSGPSLTVQSPVLADRHHSSMAFLHELDEGSQISRKLAAAFPLFLERPCTIPPVLCRYSLEGLSGVLSILEEGHGQTYMRAQQKTLGSRSA